MASAKEKQLYLQAVWMLPTVLAVGTARGGAAERAGGAGGSKAGSGRAGAGAAAGLGDRTSSGEGRRRQTRL